jgi:hypothetical protein
MVMNLILVWLVCECNTYVLSESIRRKDLGYKGYEFLSIVNIFALLFLPCTFDFNLLSFSFNIFFLAQQLIYFLRASDSATWITLQSIHFLRASDSVLWIIMFSILSLHISDVGILGLFLPVFTECFFSSERYSVIVWIWVEWATRFNRQKFTTMGPWMGKNFWNLKLMTRPWHKECLNMRTCCAADKQFGGAFVQPTKNSYS